jgi:hypothetical protein
MRRFWIATAFGIHLDTGDESYEVLSSDGQPKLTGRRRAVVDILV